ncbi:diaminopimelate epimerase [Bacillaceae bacterium SIJ1]|uniref:diaminopimelate epimerase n=1 Tax=Litoribacterium kuwaitense TaxID=1398745 RepID=UPI0013EBDE9F|nr:diaminopimelate epimerase [Litoribacterium kuwaitense]NGP46629.1 diaminopimelate epimerase [Litoribacterium kuwaitense]
MELPFVKMEALGNNYIYVDALSGNIPELNWSEAAEEVSDIYTGIGSDGLIWIGSSQVATAKMRIFNKDGSEAKNCGNGLRCVAKHIFDEGYTGGEHQFSIETLSGTVRASITKVEGGQAKAIEINMGAPIFNSHEIPFLFDGETPVVAQELQFGGTDVTATVLSMGNPHAVIFVDDITSAPIETLGPKIERDDQFPDGVNIEFIEKINRHEYNFAVWERGSGRTRACGTGACAAGVAAVLNGLSERDEDILIHLEGGDLVIRWGADHDVHMTGDARVVCRGIYYFKETCDLNPV